MNRDGFLTIDKGTHALGVVGAHRQHGGCVDDGTRMYLVTANSYDADGNLTQATQYVDDNPDDNRVTYYEYDWQDRQIGTLTPDGVATIDTLDNQGETTEEQTYADATYVSGAIVTTADDLRADREPVRRPGPGVREQAIPCGSEHWPDERSRW